MFIDFTNFRLSNSTDITKNCFHPVNLNLLIKSFKMRTPNILSTIPVKNKWH